MKYKFVPGYIAYVRDLIAIDNLKNIDLAYKYVDMSLKLDVHIKYAVKFSYALTNSKAMLPPEARTAAFNKEQIDIIIGLDYVANHKGCDMNLERFNNEVLR